VVYAEEYSMKQAAAASDWAVRGTADWRIERGSVFVGVLGGGVMGSAVVV